MCEDHVDTCQESLFAGALNSYNEWHHHPCGLTSPELRHPQEEGPGLLGAVLGELQ